MDSETNRDRRIQTVCLLTLTAIAIGVALYLLRPVLIPFVPAVFLVYCLVPGLIFFGMIWGIIGMILDTPIVAVTKIVLDRIEVTAPVGRLLAGKLDPG